MASILGMVGYGLIGAWLGAISLTMFLGIIYLAYDCGIVPGEWGLGVPLVVLTSPYRSLLRPLLEYIDQIQARGDDQMVTIVLPEFLPRHCWQHVLHNQTALLVKGARLFRRNTVVADVPYLLTR